MNSRLLRLLERWPTEKVLRASAVLGLVALALMCLGVVDPRPLQVVISMSVSQLFGGLAFLGFALSVGADVIQSRGKTPPSNGAPEKS
jgi:hypothetical protein